MVGALLVTGGDATPLLQAQDTPLDHIAFGIRFLDEPDGTATPPPTFLSSGFLVVALRNQMPDTATPQEATARLARIPPIQKQLPRTLARTSFPPSLDPNLIENGP
jgi:hypothetical protein